MAKRATLAFKAEVENAGREQFFRGREAIGRTAGMYPLSQSQNTLDVYPIETTHALAQVLYTIGPSDQGIPAFSHHGHLSPR